MQIIHRIEDIFALTQLYRAEVLIVIPFYGL